MATILDMLLEILNGDKIKRFSIIREASDPFYNSCLDSEVQPDDLVLETGLTRPDAIRALNVLYLEQEFGANRLDIKDVMSLGGGVSLMVAKRFRDIKLDRGDILYVNHDGRDRLWRLCYYEDASEISANVVILIVTSLQNKNWKRHKALPTSRVISTLFLSSEHWRVSSEQWRQASRAATQRAINAEEELATVAESLTLAIKAQADGLGANIVVHGIDTIQEVARSHRSKATPYRRGKTT